MMRFEIIFLLVLQCLNIAKSNEDDEILAEIIPTTKAQKQRRNQVNGYFLMNKQNTQYPSYTEASRMNLPVSAATKDASYNVKNDAYAIASDVDKYGLYEYTSDNTGMADQLKKLINKAHRGDENGLSQDQTLENQANQMNAKINKYIESSLDTRPTIDPLESPVGFSPITPTITPLTNNQQSGVAVITIPNTMTIEDEHGREIDSIKEDMMINDNPVKENTSLKSSSLEALRKIHYKYLHSPKPTASVIRHAPTTSLTFKLYKALKTNKNFLKNAQQLLSGYQENGVELLEKNSSVSNAIKDYNSQLKQSYSATKMNGANHQVTLDLDSKANQNNHLIKLIKKLISSEGDPKQQQKLESEQENKSNAKVRLTITKENTEDREVGSKSLTEDSKLETSKEGEENGESNEASNAEIKKEREKNQQLLNEIKKLLKSESIETTQEEDSYQEEAKLGTDVYDFLKNTDELKTFLSKNTNGKANSEWIRKFSKLGTEFPPNPVKEPILNVTNMNSNTAFKTEENKKGDSIKTIDETKKDDENVDEELHEIERQKEMLKEKERKLQKMKEEIKKKHSKSNDKSEEEKEKVSNARSKQLKIEESNAKKTKQVSNLIEKSANEYQVDETLKKKNEQRHERKKLLRQNQVNYKSSEPESNEKIKINHSKYSSENDEKTTSSDYNKQNSLRLPINNPKPSLSDSFVPHAKFFSNDDMNEPTSIIKESSNVVQESSNVVQESSNVVQESPLIISKQLDTNLENSWADDSQNLISSVTSDTVGETKNSILTARKRVNHEANKGLNEKEKEAESSPSISLATLKAFIKGDVENSSKLHNLADSSALEQRKLTENQDQVSSSEILLDRSISSVQKNFRTDEDLSRKRFIKPISNHQIMIDVGAYKKSFNDKPENPYFKDPTEKLITKEKVSGTPPTGGSANYTTKISSEKNQTEKSSSLNFSQVTENRLYKPIIPQHAFKKKKHQKKYHRFLTPRAMKSNVFNERNVIIPGSTYTKFTGSSWLKEGGDDYTDPTDITRSILPKIDVHLRKGKSLKTPIEAVFDIIGSEENRRDSILNIPVEIVKDPVDVLKNNKKIRIEIVKTLPIEYPLRKIDQPLAANNREDQTARDKITLLPKSSTIKSLKKV